MTECPETEESTQVKRFLSWLVCGTALILAALAVVTVTFIFHAEPILKGRVIETLAARFHGRVECQDFHVSVRNGFQVSGAGLKIFGPADPNLLQSAVQPLIAIAEFRFDAPIVNLLHTPMHVRRVYLKGLVVNIPPRKQQRNDVFERSKVTIYVDEFISDQAQLVINTLRPGKVPLEFDIRNLEMKEIGPGQPFLFNVTLLNPKPVGAIRSTGTFGPWQADEPRSSPVKGKYRFTHADLSTINGIGGVLSSTGEYSGTLGNIVVDGSTDTPDFRISRSGHPMPLHTDFHAIVDGTSGDTYLEPVKARFLQSSLIAKGCRRN